RYHAAEKLAVITRLYPTIALESPHANAELRDHLEVCGHVGTPRASARRLVGQPLGHPGDRSEGLGGESRCGHGLEIRGAVADPERLKSAALAQEAQHRQQRRRIRLGESHPPDPLAPQVSAPLTPIVVDLEVSRVLATDLEHIPLPERRQLGSARPRRRAECGVVLDHDGESRREGGDHYGLPAAAAALAGAPATRLAGPCVPIRFDPMNCPGGGDGAMMTCTLSESLSASVFWISSG